MSRGEGREKQSIPDTGTEALEDQTDGVMEYSPLFLSLSLSLYLFSLPSFFLVAFARSLIELAEPERSHGDDAISRLVNNRRTTPSVSLQQDLFL